MKLKNRAVIRARLGRTVLIVFAVLLSLLFIFPFWWMVSASFQPMSQLMRMPPNLFPTDGSLRGYRTLLTMNSSNFNYLRFYLNSVIVAVVTTGAQILFASLAGYGFTRYQFPGRDKIFMLMLSGMMVPPQVVVIPLYLFYSRLQIINTLSALILPGLSSVFGIFLFRQTFVSIPNDIEEAASIDGARAPRIFFTIMLPEVKSTIAAFGIMAFNGTWNAYFLPLVLASKPSSMTLPIGLTMLKNVQASPDYAVMFAGIVLAILPVFIVFLFFQKYFVAGMAGYAIKG